MMDRKLASLGSLRNNATRNQGLKVATKPLNMLSPYYTYLNANISHYGYGNTNLLLLLLLLLLLFIYVIIIIIIIIIINIII